MKDQSRGLNIASFSSLKIINPSWAHRRNSKKRKEMREKVRVGRFSMLAMTRMAPRLEKSLCPENSEIAEKF